MNFNFLKNPITASLLAGVASVLIMFLESKITENERTKNLYFKLFSLVSIITGLIVFLGQSGDVSIGSIRLTGPESSLSGSSNTVPQSGGNGIRSSGGYQTSRGQIMTGYPNF